MVVIKPIPSFSELEILWRAIGAQAHHAFYLSWPWIRTWLSCIPHWIRPQLLTVSVGGATIAAAILVKRNLWRRGIIASRTWVLNATGDPKFDQIFIEDNGLLVHNDYRDFAWREWARTFSAVADWDEISLRGIPLEALKFWEGPKSRLREEMTLPALYLELEQVRLSGLPFAATLSKKVRGRVRHTRRLLEENGPIVVETANTLDQARTYFAELKDLHQRRWIERGRRGSFGFPFFERFHTELIDKHFHEGVIQLLRVRAGNVTVGVLYNFIYNREVLVYQTGFNFSLIRNQNKESPGLLTHILAIDFNASQGYKRYDLLAGDSEYKRILAPSSRSLWWGRLQKPRFKFAMEDGLARMCRRYIRVK